MKFSILMALTFLISAPAFARTECSVNAGDPKQDMVFDKVLFKGELAPGAYVLVDKKHQSAREVRLTDFKSLPQWKAIDGETLISFSEQAGDMTSIVSAHVDLSKSKSNMLPMDAMAFGSTTGKYVSLIFPTQYLSISCISIQ